jgi:hypothetical protein
LTFAAMAFGSVAGLTAPSMQGTQAPAASPVSTAGEFQVAAAWDRVCCKRGMRETWSTRRECWRAGGYAVPNRYCERRVERVCCKRGRYDWWSTPRDCRNRGGHIVANPACRR